MYFEQIFLMKDETQYLVNSIIIFFLTSIVPPVKALRGSLTKTKGKY